MSSTMTVQVPAPASFFVKPEEMAQPLIQVRDPQATHYIFNAGFWRISLLAANLPYIGNSGFIERGVILPIFRWPYWDDDASPTPTPGAVYNASGLILRHMEPGFVAGKLEREYSQAGLVVLWDTFGQDILKDMAEISTLLNFQALSNRDGFYLDKNTPDNMAIIQRCRELIAQVEQGKLQVHYADLLVRVCRQLIAKVGGVQIAFRSNMNEIKQAIIRKDVPGLTQRDRSLCAVAGFNPADYEVDTDSNKVAMQTAIAGIGEGMAAAINRVSQVAGGSSNEDSTAAKMYKMIEAQGKMLAEQGALIAKLNAELEAVKGSPQVSLEDLPAQTEQIIVDLPTDPSLPAPLPVKPKGTVSQNSLNNLRKGR